MITVKELLLKRLAEDVLIEVYVPFAGEMTRDEALALAIDLDLAAIKQDVIDMEAAARVACQPLIN